MWTSCQVVTFKRVAFGDLFGFSFTRFFGFIRKEKKKDEVVYCSTSLFFILIVSPSSRDDIMYCLSERMSTGRSVMDNIPVEFDADDIRNQNPVLCKSLPYMFVSHLSFCL